MQQITTTEKLAEFCERCASEPYVTLDTEFLRERTYYAQLCLVQIARPGGDDDGSAAIIDPLAEGLDLAPLLELMRNPDVVKVFHAARQDLEIFWHLGQLIPKPLFDTQVAAMVLGYGDQVGYEALVRRIAQNQLDKSARFTDWSRRPLAEKQLRYALGDVTHLRVIYECLRDDLRARGRESWVEEEMAILLTPATYEVVPEEAWKRLKTRSNSGQFLVTVRALATWREHAAQTRDIPRNRIMKDDALLEIAANRPKSMQELGRSRLLLREGRKQETMEEILGVVKVALDEPKDTWPVVPRQDRGPTGSPALGDLMRVLLKAKAEAASVAPRLIASSADLDELATDPSADLPATRGWRNDVFGRDAVRLIKGEIALSASRKGVVLVELGSESETG